jgi:hypothetical protein
MDLSAHYSRKVERWEDVDCVIVRLGKQDSRARSSRGHRLLVAVAHE